MVNKTVFCSICKCKPLFFYELHHFEGFSVEDLKKFLCKFAGFDYFEKHKKIQFCLNCKDKVESAVFLYEKLVSVVCVVVASLSSDLFASRSP